MASQRSEAIPDICYLENLGTIIYIKLYKTIYLYTCQAIYLCFNFGLHFKVKEAITQPNRGQGTILRPFSESVTQKT